MVLASVVIPSYRRTVYLRDSLADLARQRGVAFECLVVLQTQPTSAELHELHAALPDKLRVFYVAEANASLARNVGLREARGEIVLFLDDDVRLPDPDFLAKHLRNFEDPTVPGVYGQVLERGQAPIGEPEPAAIETDWGWHKLPANYGHRCRTRNGASNNLAVRREWAIAVGGMDAWFERGARREETEFNLRYTKRYGPLVFDPEASLVHLSADGGSRAWGRVRRTVPMHHIVGRWYFLFVAMRDRTLGARGLAIEARLLATSLLRNPKVGYSPAAHVWNVARSLWGAALAASRIVRGARRLERWPPRYRELPTETAAKVEAASA